MILWFGHSFNQFIVFVLGIFKFFIFDDLLLQLEKRGADNSNTHGSIIIKFFVSY